jgi:hypothetical protein
MTLKNYFFINSNRIKNSDAELIRIKEQLNDLSINNNNNINNNNSKHVTFS